MIIDARTIPANKTIETDVCIAGAGIAGITVAREFIGKGFRVCLLESGGEGGDRATQSLYWGENIGRFYYPLDTSRACCFGGSSNRWSVELGGNNLGVRLRPLDDIDFEERDWVKYSGWPFKKSHLDPFYERAQSICQIGPFTYDVEDWEDPEQTPHLPFMNQDVKTAMFQFGLRDPFIRDYRDEISKADNITAYIYANVLEIETNETGKKVTRLSAATLEGNTFGVDAKLFIIASGGIDTPRLLLLSNRVHKQGLGNGNDLVGRFFMEHVHLWSGIFVPSDPGILDKAALYKIHRVKNVPVMGKLALSEDVLRREKLLNYCTSIHPRFKENWQILQEPPTAGVSALRKVGKGCKRLLSKSKKVLIFHLNHMTEQAPNPESRVTLSEERDCFGRNRVRLDWQLVPLDVRTINRAQEIIDRELRHAGLGRVEIEFHDEETRTGRIHGGWHHMGTTRMHRDPRMGVVDEHCRVHDVSNLYVAGPSVFPTGGYANPVLTVVALAARLSDHIQNVMK